MQNLHRLQQAQVEEGRAEDPAPVNSDQHRAEDPAPAAARVPHGQGNLSLGCGRRERQLEPAAAAIDVGVEEHHVRGQEMQG